MVRRNRRVLLLLSEVCANGGIQRFNLTLLAACKTLDLEYDVLSVLDSTESMRRAESLTTTHSSGFAGNRLRFVIAAVRAVCSGRYDHVLIGHVNLLRFAVAILRLAPGLRPRSTLVAHGIEVWNTLGSARGRALARIDKVLCVSAYTRDRIRSQVPQLSEHQLTVFPNALSETWVERVPSPSQGKRPSGIPHRFILSVSRLDRGERYKGIVTVLETLSMLEDDTVHYVVVGRGNDLAFLQAVADRLGVGDRTHWLGALPDDQLIDLYQQCEAFVLPSGKEGFGIVFLEAMFFGAAVVAAAEKGALDVIQHEQTGLLIRYGSVTDLKLAIDRLLADQDLREALKARAHTLVVENGAFTFKAFVARTAMLFDVASDTSLNAAAVPTTLHTSTAQSSAIT